MKRIKATIDIIIDDKNIDKFNKQLAGFVELYQVTSESGIVKSRTSINISNTYDNKTAGKVYIVNFGDKQYTFIVLRVTKHIMNGLWIDGVKYHYKSLMCLDFPIIYFRFIKDKGYVMFGDYFKLLEDEISMEDIKPIDFIYEGNIDNSLLANLVFRYRDRL